MSADGVAEQLACCSDEPGRSRASTEPPVHGGERGARGLDERPGMSVRDAVGNLIGRVEGERPDAPPLMLGSTTTPSTMPGAGTGRSACSRRLQWRSGCRRRRRPAVPLEVVAKADEEGTRFGTAFLGSSVLAGRFEAADLERVDTEGVPCTTRSVSTGAIPPASMSPPAPWART